MFFVLCKSKTVIGDYLVTEASSGDFKMLKVLRIVSSTTWPKKSEEIQLFCLKMHKQSFVQKCEYKLKLLKKIQKILTGTTRRRKKRRQQTQPPQQYITTSSQLRLHMQYNLLLSTIIVFFLILYLKAHIM